MFHWQKSLQREQLNNVVFLVFNVVLHAVVVISEVLPLSTKSRYSRCYMEHLYPEPLKWFLNLLASAEYASISSPGVASELLLANDEHPPQPTNETISSSVPYEPNATSSESNPTTQRSPIWSVVLQPRNSDKTTPQIPTEDPHSLFPRVL